MLTQIRRGVKAALNKAMNAASSMPQEVIDLVSTSSCDEDEPSVANCRAPDMGMDSQQQGRRQCGEKHNRVDTVVGDAPCASSPVDGPWLRHPFAFYPEAAASSAQVSMMMRFFKPKQGTLTRDEQRRQRMRSRELHLLHCGDEATLEDRKSVFKAFVAYRGSVAARQPLSPQDVSDARTELRIDAKIAAAAHPSMFAALLQWQPRVEDSMFLSDADGEAGAAEVLMKVLHRKRCENVAVFVTRWFGGVLLSGARFRHIDTVASRVLEFHKVA